MTNETMNNCSPEIRGRAVRIVLDRASSGQGAGVPTKMAEKMKSLERQNRKVRQANEILRRASVYFTMAELDRRSKP